LGTECLIIDPSNLHLDKESLIIDPSHGIILSSHRIFVPGCELSKSFCFRITLVKESILPGE
jgi:hypothetical protein